MAALTVPALAAAALLAVAGAGKVVDPAATVGALRALGLRVPAPVVRVGAALELVLGIAAVTVDVAPLWVLVAVSYAAFTAFVVAALRAGTMVGSCGCFGKEDTPPDRLHVVLNVLLAVSALAVAGAKDTPWFDAGTSSETWVAALLATVSVFLLYAAFVVLPRAARTSSPVPRHEH